MEGWKAIVSSLPICFWALLYYSLSLKRVGCKHHIYSFTSDSNDDVVHVHLVFAGDVFLFLNGGHESMNNKKLP